jgi:hypothetical protein
MHRGRFIFTLALALLSTSAWADVTPLVLDFSKTEDQAKMQLNSNLEQVKFENGRLVLTDDGSQAASAFISTPIAGLTDYVATFGMEIRKVDEADGDPADGVMFLVQSGGPDRIGAGGGGIGYTRANGQTSQQFRPAELDFWGYCYGVDFNTWNDNGLPDAAQTISLALMGVRPQLGETPFEVVGKGLITYTVRVTPDQVTVTANGGTDNLANKVLFTSPRIVGFFTAPNPLFVGWTAGTGGARQHASITGLSIQPAPPPATAGG